MNKFCTIHTPSSNIKTAFAKPLALLLIVLLTLSAEAIAQKGAPYIRCQTSDGGPGLASDPADQKRLAAFEQWMTQKRQEQSSARTSSGTFIIPVIVHVVHEGEAVGIGTNIPAEQVASQLLVLNEDFTRNNPDRVDTPSAFEPVAGGLDVLFLPAKVDPEGNPLEEPGIIRYQGKGEAYTRNEVIDELMRPNMWDPRKYCNVWVANMQVGNSNLLGFGLFPEKSGLNGIDGDVGSSDIGSDEADGIAIGYKFFGSDFAGFGAFNLHEVFNRGRTATHEMGHYLGLRHIWGDGSSCNFDDFCADTPTVRFDNDGYGLSNGCAFPKDDDGVGDCDEGVNDLPDMFQNYMDYTPDVCMNLFTECQVTRMQIVLENSPRRVELIENAQVIADVEDDLPEAEVSLYPNPFKETFELVVQQAAGKEMNLQVFNALGKVLYTAPFGKVAQNVFRKQITLPHHLPAGLYYLRLNIDESVVVKKIYRN